MLKKLLERLTLPDREPEPGQLTALAAAALLLEVSWADHDMSEAELDHIAQSLQRTFRLVPQAARDLIEQARREHDASVGLYGYTRVINEHWDEPARFDLVVALWQLALADDELDRYEEHTIRRIAELLYVDHARFIEAKLRAKQRD